MKWSPWLCVAITRSSPSKGASPASSRCSTAGDVKSESPSIRTFLPSTSIRKPEMPTKVTVFSRAFAGSFAASIPAAAKNRPMILYFIVTLPKGLRPPVTGRLDRQ